MSYVAAARSTLGRRWRIAERTEDSGALTISAEKGYSRETGNLIFHIALLVALVLIAHRTAVQVRGHLDRPAGIGGVQHRQRTTTTGYPVGFAAEGKIQPAPFCITKVNKFTATYDSSGEPREFAADVTYVDNGRDKHSPKHHATIKVNHPLRLEGDRVYLTGHGFAPTVTIRLPNGTVQTRNGQLPAQRRHHAVLTGRLLGDRRSEPEQQRRHHRVLRADAGIRPAQASSRRPLPP